MGRNLKILIKIRYNYLFILPIIFYITGCANNGNNSFDILDDAKTFFLDLAKNPKDKEKKIKAESKMYEEDFDEEIKGDQIKIIEKKEGPKAELNISNQQPVKKEEGKYEFLTSQKKIADNKEVAKKENKTIESRIIENKKFEIAKIEEQNKEEIFEQASKDQIYKSQKKLVGVMLPLTGEKKEIGHNILSALELALFQNRESNIELIIKDTKADPATTLQIYNELLIEGIDIFIGPLYSSSLVAIEDLSQIHNTTLFALTNNVSLAKKGVYVFGIYPQQQAERIIRFSHNQGAEKVALLLPNNAYGFLLFDQIENTLSELGKEVIRVEYFDDNIESQINAAKIISVGFKEREEKLKQIKENSEENALNDLIEDNLGENPIPFDSIFIAASGQALTILASQLQYNSVDIEQVSFIGISSWEDDNILREPALEGGVFTTTSNQNQKNIKNIYETNFKKDMLNISMIAYDIVALLNAVIEKDKLNKDLLLNEEGYIGLRGLFRLTEIGIVERVFQVKKITRKKFITIDSEPKNFLDF